MTDQNPFVSETGLAFCLDLANNHQGSVEHGMRILDGIADVAKRTGADVSAKLQLRDLESLLHPADRFATANGRDVLSRHTKRFLETALDRDELLALVNYARRIGVNLYATPFDERSLDRCLELGMKILKVASCSAYDWPLLQRIAKTKLPVIVSLGGLTLNEIDDVVDFFERASSPLALMHCVSAYPTRLEDIQLDVIRQIQVRYPHLVVGYSGHESRHDLEVAGWAIASGARMLERHVGLPLEGAGLNDYSLTPEEAERWIRFAQKASTVCAPAAPRRAVEGESASLMSLRRGIYARTTIAAGQTVRASDVYLAMPCFEGQFHAGKYFEIVDSFTPMQPIYPNMPIGLHVPVELPKALLLSSIAARVREMLASAKIRLDGETDAEISHQYGFDRFFDVGAVIINVINRDYCKKLIVQFPRQGHPSHRHKQKEETFQVLTGAVTLQLNGTVVQLEAGQKQLIEREMFHSFSTDTGVIFEEVSTTHVIGDSEYEDASIPQDPAARKTRITI